MDLLRGTRARMAGRNANDIRRVRQFPRYFPRSAPVSTEGKKGYVSADKNISELEKPTSPDVLV